MATSGSPAGMRRALFYTFLAIFVLTALVTLLGIMGVVRIEDFYLKGLFGALLLELVGAIIGLFRGTDFFAQDDNPRRANPGPPTARIDEPTPNQRVGRTIDIRGTATGIPATMHLWLAVEANGFVWPKREIRVDDGNEWRVSIFEDGHSARFAVALFLVSPDGDAAIRKWLDDGQSAGEYGELKSLPGADRLTRVEGLQLKRSAAHG
jgi:hypothetical protein